MVNVFIIANGSNDLYYAVAKTLNEARTYLAGDKDIRLYVFYKMIKCDHLDLWTKKEDFKECKENGIGGYISKDGKIKKIDVSRFFRFIINNGHISRIMAPDLFLQEYLDNNSTDANIVAITGHGGPFQSFLDMDVSPSISLNTIKLCKRLKNFKIDLLFLDMCAMNYIEIIYEILSEGYVRNVMTYKNLAPFDGINYRKLIESIEDIRSGVLDYHGFTDINGAPLIMIGRSAVPIMNGIRNIQNEIVMDMVQKTSPDFDTKLKEIADCINKMTLQNKEAESLKVSPLNYIKYRLTDKNEQKLYSQYSYNRDNLWQFIVRGDIYPDYSFDREFINLDAESLENIVYLHNADLNELKIKDKVKSLINARKEQDYYKIIKKS